MQQSTCNSLFCTFNFISDPACQNINTQNRCYIMDPTCPFQLLSNKTENSDTIGYVIGSLGGFIAILSIVLILVYRSKKGKVYSMSHLCAFYKLTY